MGFSLRAVVFSVAIFVWTLDCAAVIGEQQRLKFMQAEEMIKSGDDQGFSILSLELVDYPLYFYLNYQWLSDNLDQDKKIQQFLQDNDSPLYARMLHRQWLDYLYKNKQWGAYVENYRNSKSKQGQCRYQWARYQLNYKTKALTAAKKIWLTGSSLPRDCDHGFLIKKYIDICDKISLF